MSVDRFKDITVFCAVHRVGNGVELCQDATARILFQVGLAETCCHDGLRTGVLVQDAFDRRAVNAQVDDWIYHRI